jgi:hypothetical protein
MNILRIDFPELYQRHLCRHSQYGINVGHLASVFGTYLAIVGILFGLFESWWVLLGVLVPYFLVLAFNIPVRVFAVVLVFMALLLSLFYVLPPLPLWVYPLLILVFYKLQAWSHKIYTVERDMTEFNKKYPKGLTLFVLLSIYELPILLNYLAFDSKSWSTEAKADPILTEASSAEGHAVT